MIRYEFKEEFVAIKDFKRADPQRIGVALERIADANGGKLTPRDTVTAAQAPRHVLHRHFEWNDALAADAHRLEQARRIIRSIRIVYDSDETQTPRHAFLSVAIDKEPRAYYPHQAVVTSVRLQSRILLTAERDLAAWERRYSELSDICDEVRSLREKLAERRRRMGESGEDGDTRAPW